MNKETIVKALDSWWTKNKSEAADELGLMLADQELDRTDVQAATIPPVKSTLRIIDGPKMPTQGKFAKGGPLGAVIHFTGGRYEKGMQSAFEAAEYGNSQQFAYWVIARDGTVLKTHELDSWGWHCGASFHKDLGYSLSKHLLGIEIVCAGNLRLNGDTWWGDPVPHDEIREIKTRRYAEEEQTLYHKFTEAQETALIELLAYLKKRDPANFNYDYVVGHDEISRPVGRKCDSGGSLSMGVPELRKLLKSRG
jgi:hypothetical protein